MPDDNAGTLLDFEFGVTPLADQANRQLAAALCQCLRDEEIGMVGTRPAGGRPVPGDDAGRIGTVIPRPAGGRPVPDDVCENV